MNKELQKHACDILEHKASLLKKIFCILLAVFFVTAGIWLIFKYKAGCFSDAESFKEYIESFGIFGPFFITIFQCLKVVYAVIPGTIGYIVSPSLFGPLTGIITNYIGICCGSFIAFWLSRKFGISFVKQIFSEKKYNSWMKKMAKWHKSYPLFLWVGLLIPISPDDFLCYFSGLTNISFKKFAFIILTAKPWTIIAYSLIFGNIFGK